jgi:hypothetical protein
MTPGAVANRLCATLVGLFLAFAPLFAVPAAEQHRRVTVVSFGLSVPKASFVERQPPLRTLSRADSELIPLLYGSIPRLAATRPSKRLLPRCKRRQQG